MTTLARSPLRTGLPLPTLLPASVRLRTAPVRATPLAQELEPVVAQVVELEGRVDRLVDSVTATRRAFLSLRSQAVTLPT